MSDTTARSRKIREVRKLIDNFDTAMLVTESVSGDLRARPMAIAGHSEGAVLHFLTRREAGKLDELSARSRVSVVMQGRDLYLSISGFARVIDDPALTERFWSPLARLWFPEGPRDKNLVLLRVAPVYAESWDRRALRKLEFWWEAGKALVNQTRAVDQGLSGHKKLKL